MTILRSFSEEWCCAENRQKYWELRLNWRSMDEKFCKKNKNGFTWILQKQNNSRIDEKIFLLYDNHQGFYSKWKEKRNLWKNAQKKEN